MNPDGNDWLLRGMVEDHARLYSENAYFHQSIDMLVTMIPAVVDGLVAQAVDNEERMKAAVHRLMTEPFMPLVIPEGLIPDGIVEQVNSHGEDYWMWRCTHCGWLGTDLASKEAAAVELGRHAEASHP